MNKKVTLVGWHLGNYNTIGQAAVDVLNNADVILLEMDPNVPSGVSWPDGFNPGDALLLNAHKIKSYYYYEKTRFAEILNDYDNIAVVASAGMPGIQDPGASIIAEVSHDDTYEIDLIPGPDSITSTIALSGFDTLRFAFGGMLHIGEPEEVRLATIRSMHDARLSTVFFTRDAMVENSLIDLISIFGENRNAVLVANISRPDLKVKRGSLGSILSDKDFIQKVNGSTSRSRVTIAVEGV
jgi:16S rRNA (cytidine1402-2'-O)-methyltransferase